MNRRLIVRPNLMPTESLRGYVFRLAQENRCGPEVFADFFNLRSVSHAVARIAELSDVSIDILSTRLGERPLQVFSRHGQWLNERIPYRCVELRRRKVCVACLSEGSPYRVDWEFVEVGACSTHNRELVSTCKRCGKELTWESGNFYRCGCGFDLRESVAIPASVASRLISQVISEAVAPTDAGQRHLLKMCMIDASHNATRLPLRWLLIFFSHLRATFIPTLQKQMAYGKTRRKPPRKSSDDTLVLRVIGYWPLNYTSLLQLLMQAMNVSSDVSRRRSTAMIKQIEQNNRIHNCLEFARDNFRLAGPQLYRATPAAHEFRYVRPGFIDGQHQLDS